VRRTTAFAAAILFAGIISVRGVTAAPARSTCASQTAPKLTPQERTTQRDIQAAIDQQIEELAAMDIDAATRLMPKDFSIRLLDGTTLNRDQAIAGMRQEKASVLRVDIASVCISLARKPSSTQNNNMSAPFPTSKTAVPTKSLPVSATAKSGRIRKTDGSQTHRRTRTGSNLSRRRALRPR
jgi:hypothetical protein